MKSLAYYRELNRRDAEQRKRDTPRRSPFKVEKTTTGNSTGYVVLFEMNKEIQMLRVQNGYVTWAAQSQSATIFRTPANAKAAIEAYQALFTHSYKMTKYDIISVGEAEIYHG